MIIKERKKEQNTIKGQYKKLRFSVSHRKKNTELLLLSWTIKGTP